MGTAQQARVQSMKSLTHSASQGALKPGPKHIHMVLGTPTCVCVPSTCSMGRLQRTSMLRS